MSFLITKLKTVKVTSQLLYKNSFIFSSLFNQFSEISNIKNILQNKAEILSNSINKQIINLYTKMHKQVLH